jgi:predicted dehydrogenase
MCNDCVVVGGEFSSQFNKTLESAELEDFDKNRCYSDVQSLVTGENSLAEEDRMQVVSIVTPNSFHYQQAKILLENSCHVVCDKPVAITSAKAEELGRIVARTGKVFCITHTYTGIHRPLSIGTNDSLHR